MMYLKRKYSSLHHIYSFQKYIPLQRMFFMNIFFYFPIFLHTRHSNNTRNFSVKNKSIFQVDDA